MDVFEPYGFIYITTNLINGKRYVGQRKFSKRWETYIGSGSSLKLAISKYGLDNFKRDIVDIGYSKDELNNKEKDWIKALNAVDSIDYYNIMHGGYNSEISYNNLLKRNKNISKSLKGHPSLVGRIGSKSPSAKKVICLNTLMIFDSLVDASNFYNISNKLISACCIGTRNYAMINGVKFIFEFLTNEILGMNEIELYNYSKNKINNAIYISENWNKKGNHPNARMVICLNTSVVYDCIKSASNDCGNISQSNITEVCLKNRRFAGRINGENAIWEFYEGEITNYTQEELYVYCRNRVKFELDIIKSIGKGKNHPMSRKVRCINTGEIFDTIIEASEKYKIHKTSVSNAIYGNCKSGGKDEFGNKLFWEYAD